MTGPSAPIPTRKPPRFGVPWAAVLIALAGMAAYADSFSGPFIYDDRGSVIYNRSIRSLATAFRPDQGSGQTVAGRPILNLSFAINYAISGTQVWSYHALNLLIHILAGLTLFGIVRRTLELWECSRFREKSDEGRILTNSATALAIALIWTVHPLQTEAVTYIVQRAESLMSLFFLLTFYCFIRLTEVERVGPNALGSSRERGRAVWYALCVGSFLLGVGTKELIVTALPLLLLYDSIFISGSLAKAWRVHRGLWISLSCCLIVLVALVASTGWNRNGSIGLGIGVSPFAYALTQPLALLTYLKLCVLPFPLVFDYGTFWIPFGWEFCLQAAGIAALLALTAVALKRAPGLGFIGAWFFLILAPTSLAPGATQMIVEHRMYLPLAAVATLFVLMLHRLLGRRSFPVLLAAALVFCWLTSRRNETYRTDVGIWSDTIAKSPDNERAHYALGNALDMAGRTAEAIAQYEEALRLKPDDARTHNNLGNTLRAEGRIPEAIDQFEAALRLNANIAEAHYNLGIALSSEGRTAEAIVHYEEAVRLDPDYADARNNLGVAFSKEGRTAEAIMQYKEVVRLKPDYADARNNLGIALYIEGRASEAIDQFEKALSLDPDDARFHFNLALALLKIPGRTDEAVAHFKTVLRLQPDNDRARKILAEIGAPEP